MTIKEGYIIRDSLQGGAVYVFWNASAKRWVSVHAATYYATKDQPLPAGNAPHWVPISKDGSLK